MADHRSLSNTKVRKRPVLRVEGEGIASWLGYDEFDLPEAIALAGEGFCPYHRDGPPVPMTRQSDGTVVCSESGYQQTWTWFEEEVNE